MYSSADVQAEDAGRQDAGHFWQAFGRRKGIVGRSHGNLQRERPSDLRLAISRLADVGRAPRRATPLYLLITRLAVEVTNILEGDCALYPKSAIRLLRLSLVASVLGFSSRNEVAKIFARNLTVRHMKWLRSSGNIGMGDKFNEKDTRAMTAGTYGYWPAGMKHFVWAKGETILQYHGSGPWTIEYVNPSDDPRKK